MGYIQSWVTTPKECEIMDVKNLLGHIIKMNDDDVLAILEEHEFVIGIEREQKKFVEKFPSHDKDTWMMGAIAGARVYTEALSNTYCNPDDEYQDNVDTVQIVKDIQLSLRAFEDDQDAIKYVELFLKGRYLESQKIKQIYTMLNEIDIRFKIECSPPPTRHKWLRGLNL